MLTPAIRLRIPEALPSVVMREWLLHEGSLTEKLRQTCGPVHLNVLSERWVRTDWWAKQVLQLNDSMVWQREIEMLSKDRPCWYAKTLIPYETVHAQKPLFARLAHEPLTGLIFNNPHIVRTGLMHYPVDANCLEYYWPPCKVKEPIHWVRLAAFLVDNLHAFYLLEYFLPGFWERVV